MDREDNRYQGSRWTSGGVIGCAVWPVTSVLLIDPMIEFILGPCFWEGGCGVTAGLGGLAAIVAAMLAAIPVSIAVRALINLLLGRLTDW